ncbi:MAG: FAD-dependent oxidoreductase [Planctomycetes bacterium]|nr:FAD-dependent oxidoreductase [Planctomycetota bacterium]
MPRLVIIGNSAAGLTAIEAIRARNRRSRIALIAAETHRPYSRIMLTYLLAGKVARDDLFLHRDDWYERMHVEALLGYRATAIDTRRSLVVAKRNGQSMRVSFDRLLIATGALAERPNLPGIDLPGVFCLRDLDDAVAILRYVEMNGLLGCWCEDSFSHPLQREFLPAKSRIGILPGVGARRDSRTSGAPRAVFLGAGPVCLQALTALANRGMRVTLLVRSEQILSQLADADTAGLAERVLRAGGVQVVKGAAPIGIEANTGKGGSRLAIHLADGRRQPADLIIIGKGTQPNLELVRKTPIATDAGILVDETMETSLPGVFAAGDVTQATHCVTGRKTCYGTWTNACEQGRIAGLNMIGRRIEWTGGLNRNVTTFFGNTLGSVGLTRMEAGDGCELHAYQDRRRSISRRLTFRDGCLQGAVLWNACDDLGVLSSLISTGRDCHGREDHLARRLATSADALRTLTTHHR